LGARRRQQRGTARAERRRRRQTLLQRGGVGQDRRVRRRPRHQHLARLERAQPAGMSAGSEPEPNRDHVAGTDAADPFGRDQAAWTSAWEALRHHHGAMADVHMRDLFAADPQRFERYTMVIDGGHEAPVAAAEERPARAEVLVDLSKHRATDETYRLL